MLSTRSVGSVAPRNALGPERRCRLGNAGSRETDATPASGYVSTRARVRGRASTAPPRAPAFRTRRVLGTSEAGVWRSAASRLPGG